MKKCRVHPQLQTVCHSSSSILTRSPGPEQLPDSPPLILFLLSRSHHRRRSGIVPYIPSKHTVFFRRTIIQLKRLTRGSRLLLGIQHPCLPFWRIWSLLLFSSSSSMLNPELMITSGVISGFVNCQSPILSSRSVGNPVQLKRIACAAITRVIVGTNIYQPPDLPMRWFLAGKIARGNVRHHRHIALPHLGPDEIHRLTIIRTDCIPIIHFKNCLLQHLSRLVRADPNNHADDGSADHEQE